MLRKRTRSNHKDQLTNNSMACAIPSSYLNHKNTSFLNVPGFFIGSNGTSPQSESSRSPTSPLDFRIFLGFGNPFRRSKALPNQGSRKSWDSHKVGLSIIDSLEDKPKQPGNVLGSSNNKNILFGRQMSARTSYNLGKSSDVQRGSSNVVFEVGPYGSSLSNSVVHNKKNATPSEPRLSPFSVNSGTCFIGSVPTNEIELSEDYTCVRTHGPNPKVIHIFGDCILERHGAYLSDDFLKFCYTCNKKLEGQDVYMYRGEKAFCSCNCRLLEIEIDEDMEESENDISEL